MAVRLGPEGGGAPTVRQVLRDRRFRLGALPAGMRPGAVAVLVVIIAWSGVIALNAAGAGVTADGRRGPGGGFELATLAPTGWAGLRWFYLALLFPVAAQFLYLGAQLNQTASRRPELVLLSLAAVALRLRRPETA